MTRQKESKTFKFEIKEESIIENDDYFEFEGYASTFGNIDLGEDIIVKGAFAKSLAGTPQVPVLWQHKMGEPIGISIQLFEDERGLFIKAKLPKQDDLVSGRVIPQIKVGSIKEMSIGFFTVKSEIDQKSDIRRILEIELFEVSLVTKAMNPQALLTGFKSAGSLKDVEQTLKDSGFSNTEAKALISKVKEFSKQRDAEEKEVQREAEEKATLLAKMEELTNLINKK